MNALTEPQPVYERLPVPPERDGKPLSTPSHRPGPPAKAGRSTQLVRHLREAARWLGVSGGAGALLLAFAGLLFIKQHLPLQRSVAVLSAELKAAAAARPAPSDTRRGTVVEFVAGLPQRSELPAILAQIMAQATAAQLELEKGSYTISSAKSGRILRYELTFPVHGTYPAVRRFVDGTLVAVPSAALAGLRLERSAVSSAQIEAEIRFVIFARNTT